MKKDYELEYKKEDGKDWLDLYQQSKKQNDYSIKQLTIMANSLGYTFPNIAKDLYNQIDNLQYANEMIDKSFNMHMNERITDANNFIGTALSGLLNKGENND